MFEDRSKLQLPGLDRRGPIVIRGGKERVSTKGS